MYSISIPKNLFLSLRKTILKIVISKSSTYTKYDTMHMCARATSTSSCDSW